MKSEWIRRAARDIKKASYIVALTGAGISVESGIPPFRGKGGLWEKIDPMEFAHIDALMANPKKVWEVLIRETKDFVDKARPNDAHIGLFRLEKMGKLKTVITQNIDGLHQRAGNSDVIEFHGNFAWQRCTVCERKVDSRQIRLDALPPRCDCGGFFRPDCVFFGEMIPPQALDRSRRAAMECDVMLVVGTSAEVQPAAYMPVVAKQSGATIIEINPESTHLTNGTSDYIILEKAGDAMNAILSELESL